MNKKDNQVTDVVKEQLPQLQSVFENIAKKEGYINYDIKITKITSGGANYSGELFEVDVKGKTKDGDKETNLFLKRSINDDVLGDLVTISSAYSIENFVYQELGKRYFELQIEANVPEEERYKMAKSYENSDSTAIILENLAKKGFRTPYRMDIVLPKYAELCMKELAKFHALSFALQRKDPEYFNKKLRPLKYIIKDDEKSMLSLDKLAQMVVMNLDPVYKPKAEKVVVALHESFLKYHSAERSPVNCLCYGDFRASNILMRENEGDVAEVIPVDYQAIYYGCPITDILFFMTCGTDRKFRAQHFENLKTLYHNTLSDFLNYFNIDPNDVFSRKQMDDIFDQMSEYVPMLAVFGFAFIFAPENELDVNKSIVEANLGLDEKFQERLIEILEDFPMKS